MTHVLFEDRLEAGERLAAQMQKQRDGAPPLVLAIPRGGIEVGEPLARLLDAELDIILARKLRDPNRPDLAMGALSEDGHIFLNESVTRKVESGCIEYERARQMIEMERTRALSAVSGPRRRSPGGRSS